MKLCLRPALPCIVGAILTTLLASSPAAAADGCKWVNIDAKVTIGGVVRAGVIVKVGTDWDQLEDSLDYEPDGAITLTTDGNGRIKGGFNYCDGDAPPLLFHYRTDFNADSHEVEASQENFNFTKTINFGPFGAEDYRAVHPATKVKFRFPVQNPSLINHHNHLEGVDPAAAFFSGGLSTITEYMMSGPLGLDHRPLPQSGKIACLDYAGNGGTIGAPYCYGKHRGTDFMLIGGFDQMDNGTNYIVAAADGVVTFVDDTHYDRCHQTIGPLDNDPGVDVTCDGKNGFATDDRSFSANEIIINHGFDIPDKRYAVTSRYLHIKQDSARVEKGQFVRCGQVLAEIGSSGDSSAPHLHFEVTQEGEIVDPYQGLYSSQSYWTAQSVGERELPGVTCQDPKDRYGDIKYWADLIASSPQDLGIRDKAPSGEWNPGKARWWRIVVTVDHRSVVGFRPEFTEVTWTLPKSAVIDEGVEGVRNRKQYVIRAKLGGRITFYVPIANARSPRLADYSFDVLAELKQEQFGNAAVQRFVHVDIPKPTLDLVQDARMKVVDTVPACGAKKPVYQVKYNPGAKGLLGKPGDSPGAPTAPTLQLKVVSQSTFETLSSNPISVCYGDTVKITATAVDPQGVEKVTTVKTLRSPRFITDARIAPDIRVRGTPVVIPATHSGEQPFETMVFKQVRLTTDPRDVGDGSLPPATPKPIVNIAWTNLQYLDRETKAWVPVEIGKRGVVKASYEQGKRKNDTLVLEFTDTSWPTVFTGKLTVTDGWGRTITQDIHGANGKLPPPPTPNGLEQLLVEAGFQLGGDPEPIEALPNSSLPGEGVAELSGLVRALSDAYIKHDNAAVAALRTKVQTFSTTTAKTKAKGMPTNLVH
jgi:murein DD-endopeptidase MepM/ murein hydrolase activator NlpD